MKREEKVEYYVNRLLEWNRKINLTGLKTREDINNILIKQSLLALKFIDDVEGLKAIDLGTGSGIPGIPIKIYRDKITMHLVDRNGKKIAFMKKIIRDLALKDVETYKFDFEILAKKPEFNGQYDLVLSRGIGLEKINMEIIRAFLKPGGNILSWKTGNPCPVIQPVNG